MPSIYAGRFLWNVMIGASLAAVALSGLAQQPYPNRPLRLIVPLAPGGTTDIMARTMSQLLAGPLGQTVVVENRSGAGGTVGSDFVAKSPPDGYTLLIISADTYTTNAVLYTNLPFDSRKDLRPLSILAASPSILTVHPSLPVKSVSQLVALSKARPKDLNYGSGGTSGVLRMELLKFNTGIKGFDENVGYLMLVPSATPGSIVARLNADIVKVLNTPEVKGRLASEGSEVVGSTSELAVAVVNQQIDQWVDVVKRTGIKLQ